MNAIIVVRDLELLVVSYKRKLVSENVRHFVVLLSSKIKDFHFLPSIKNIKDDYFIKKNKQTNQEGMYKLNKQTNKQKSKHKQTNTS